jgi:hypothetical protein
MATLIFMTKYIFDFAMCPSITSIQDIKEYKSFEHPKSHFHEFFSGHKTEIIMVLHYQHSPNPTRLT